MIVDTDVLIWCARGNQRSISEIEEIIPFSVSVITVMELLQGVKNKTEQKITLDMLNMWGTEIIYPNESISKMAMQFVKDFSLSRGIGIEDAFVAATAIEKSEELFTANDKHFRFVPGLRIKSFRP